MFDLVVFVVEGHAFERPGRKPAAVGYFHGSAYGILVLAVTKTGIARINGFASPELVAKFGFAAKV